MPCIGRELNLGRRGRASTIATEFFFLGRIRCYLVSDLLAYKNKCHSHMVVLAGSGFRTVDNLSGGGPLEMASLAAGSHSATYRAGKDGCPGNTELRHRSLPPRPRCGGG